MNALVLMQRIKLAKRFTTLTILKHLYLRQRKLYYSLPSIQIVATGLCGTQMKMLANVAHYPIILGHEGTGIVKSVGGVSTVKTGLNWHLELGKSSNLGPTSVK